jgi:hypothetical protein
VGLSGVALAVGVWVVADVLFGFVLPGFALATGSLPGLATVSEAVMCSTVQLLVEVTMGAFWLCASAAEVVRRSMRRKRIDS